MIPFCPLASGLLTDKYLGGDIPAESRAAQKWGKEWVEKNLNPQKRETLIALMALAWTLRLPAITSALIGASSVSQIEENVKALDNLEFSKEELAEIDRLTKGRP